MKIINLVMKFQFLTAFIVFSLIGCKENNEIKKNEFASFGDKITLNDTISREEMFEKYKSLKRNDTLNLKFSSTIHEICQNKGCWMTLELEGDKEAFVKFKDYSFFVPMNAQNRNVIVEGKAFIEETSVKQLKHFAEDEGLSQEVIDTIKHPKLEYKFEAKGVLISK